MNSGYRKFHVILIKAVYYYQNEYSLMIFLKNFIKLSS